MVAAAIAGAAVVGAAGSAISAGGASDAASAEAQGIASQIAFQREVFQQNRADLAPFRQLGVSALTDLADIFGIQRPGEGLDPRAELSSLGTNQKLQEIDRLGREFNASGGERVPTYAEFLGSRPDLHGGGEGALNNAINAYISEFGDKITPAQETITDDQLRDRQENALNKFTEFPGFQFRLEQGQQAQDRSAAARGTLLSGRQIKETERFAQGQASQEFGNFLSGKFALAGIGQNAVNTTVQAAQGSSGQIGNALAGQGAARASGIVGQTNALSSGINSFGQTAGFGLGGGFGTFGSPGGGTNQNNQLFKQ